MNDYRPMTAASEAARVLVFATDPGTAHALQQEAGRLGCLVRASSRIELAIDSIERETFEVCLAECDNSTLTRLAQALATAQPSTRLIRIMTEAELRQRETIPAVRCAELSYPAPAGRLAEIIENQADRSRLLAENLSLKRQLMQRGSGAIVGNSPAMVRLRQEVQQAATGNTSVLIEGPLGSGKDQIAQAIHVGSNRADQPFFSLDCSLYSAEALERELLGDHRPGRIEQAGEGTLFLDHIECMPFPLQRRLLSAIVEKSIVNPATSTIISCRARIIAAAAPGITAEASAGRFRSDLLQTLSERVVQAPALSNCREDIPLLAEQFARTCCLREGIPHRPFSVDAMDLLRNFDWPGNVDELRRVIDRVCVLDGADRITAAEVRPWLESRDALALSENAGMTLRDMERKLIEATFNRCGGNREMTAHLLQIGIRTLSGKLREYGYPPRGGPGSNRKIAIHRAA